MLFRSTHQIRWRCLGPRLLRVPQARATRRPEVRHGGPIDPVGRASRRGVLADELRACHAPEEKVELKWDAEGKVITPAAHTNDVARHGRTIGNDHCFNCHDPANLNELHTPGGKKLKLTESTLLCASCHGPSYRDWEAGVHGRRNGFWNAKLGATDRKDCTSCHDPHAPAIPLLKPLPPPARVVVKGH